jgi:hypothetical protein
MNNHPEITLNRFWGPPVKIPSYWHERLSLLHSQAILGHDSVEVPVDHLGFRLDTKTNFSQFQKWKKNSKTKVLCLGGSTTFGYYCDSDQSWPHFLGEQNIDLSVINAGLVKGDLWQSLRSLVDILRNGHIPDSVIFLDGVNQYSGYLQSKEGFSEFRPVSPQYWNLREIHRFFGMTLRQQALSRIRQFLQGLFQRTLSLAPSQIKKEVKRGFIPVRNNQTQISFIDGECQMFLSTKNVICNILKSYGVKNVFFFLQPTLYDVLSHEDESGKFEYMKSLYEKIVRLDSSVIDISGDVEGLLPEHFLDWVHTDVNGNERIAAAIGKRIVI